MNRIKEILQEQKRTQVWLSQQLDKSYTVITNYCNNKKQPPIPVLLKIAEILEVDIRELLIPSKDTESQIETFLMLFGNYPILN